MGALLAGPPHRVSGNLGQSHLGQPDISEGDALREQ